MQSCVCVMETPYGVCNAAIVMWWWTKLTNKDFQHSITALGFGICKVNPILPDVKQSSLYIRSLPSRLLKYFSMITYQVIAQKDVKNKQCETTSLLNKTVPCNYHSKVTSHINRRNGIKMVQYGNVHSRCSGHLAQ